MHRLIPHRPRHLPPCKPDPAFGKNGANCDFTAGACDGFHTMAGKAVTYDSRGAIVAMDAPGQAPTLRSDNYLFFGRVDVEMQAAPGKGIVTSLVLLSDDLDEIDFETVGFDNKQIQSNYFSKGDDSVFDRGGNHAVDNPLGAIHKYTFEWTPEKIDWIINGAVVKLGAWVAGYEGGRPGTIEWSGGIADFSNGPATAIYKSVKVVDYAGGSSATDKDVKEYVYGDHSGSAKSIKINLKDGSSSTPDASAPASSTTAASSASSVSASSASASAPASSSQKSSVTSAKSITTSAAPSIITTEALPTKNSTSTAIAATSSAVNGTNATTTLTTATGSRTSASSTPTSPPTSGASGSGAMFGAAVLLLAALAI
ncbi:putative glycosidase crf1 [Beauveria bassiana]|nr:putative glycosidase crf1 [Beauveria bassiana]